MPWEAEAREQQQQQFQQQQQQQHQDLQAALTAENKRFGDILQSDFIDSYSNVTLKALSGLDFATRTTRERSAPGIDGHKQSADDIICGNAFHYLAKVDDDVFLNIDNVARYLWERKIRYRFNPELFVGGQCDWHMPKRFPGNKWFVGPLEYPHLSYPTYCHGFTIFYSMEAAKRIYQVSRNTPFFRFDDVYLTGLIATRHLGLTVTDIYGIFIHGAPKDICFRKKVMLSEHGEGGKQLVNDWKTVFNAECQSWES